MSSCPRAATISHYRDELGLDLIPGTGLLAACIPGTFDTWMTLLRDYGTMRLADVLGPAIDYAKNGFPLVERASATIDTVKDQFREHWPTSAAVYLPNGKVPAPGTIFTNPKFAETYERILREAQAGGGSRENEIERARSNIGIAPLRLGHGADDETAVALGNFLRPQICAIDRETGDDIAQGMAERVPSEVTKATVPFAQPIQPQGQELQFARHGAADDREL